MGNRLWVVLLSLLVLSAVACGDDDDSGGAGAGAGSGSSGSGGGASGNSGGGGMSSSGSGGMSSSGSGGMSSSGSGGMSSSGSGGSMASPPVECGTATCKSMGYFRACCVDEATSTCGVQNTMLHVECAPPGEPDPKCPDRPAAMNQTAKGCCASDGVCGVFLRGSPCISLAGQDAGPLIACGEDADAGK
jgi:hypothetical protein